MAFDRNRPIPWARVLREAVVFIVAGVVVLAVFLDEGGVGNYVGLVIGALLYVTFVATLSKFGYRRQTLGELRAASRAQHAARASRQAADAPPPPRPKPAPTKRTSGTTRGPRR
jgi:hypothetical protein